MITTTYPSVRNSLSSYDNTPIEIGTNQYIRLDSSFRKQLRENPELFADQNDYSLKEKMRISADVLVRCFPDKISLQLTNDRSIFYTIIKEAFTIYFEHFLVNDFDDTDECIVTIYKGQEKVWSFAGSMAETINHLSSELSKENITLPVFA
jgi:hypothetical protein